MTIQGALNCNNAIEGDYSYRVDVINEQVGRLQGIVKCDVDAKTCQQISCSYDTRITLCNDVGTTGDQEVVPSSKRQFTRNHDLQQCVLLILGFFHSE